MLRRASSRLHLVWFKRDLRVADHAPLREAARLIAENGWQGDRVREARSPAANPRLLRAA